MVRRGIDGKVARSHSPGDTGDRPERHSNDPVEKQRHREPQQDRRGADNDEGLHRPLRTLSGFRYGGARLLHCFVAQRFVNRAHLAVALLLDTENRGSGLFCFTCVDQRDGLVVSGPRERAADRFDLIELAGHPGVVSITLPQSLQDCGHPRYALFDVLMPSVPAGLLRRRHHVQQSGPLPILLGAKRHEIHRVGELLLKKVFLGLLDVGNAHVCGLDHRCQKDNHQPEADEKLAACRKIKEPFHV